MRWAETCVLVADPESYQADDGSWHEGEAEETTVFCNPYTVGLEQWAVSNRDLGLRADAELQVRSADYAGQRGVVFGGREYTVERVTGSGEFTRLQLGRKAGNV